MKSSIIKTVCLAVLCAGINFTFANNERQTESIEERLEAIQYSQNQMFFEVSEQVEKLVTEIRAAKQSLQHLAWYSDYVTQAVASIQRGNELLIKNVTLLTSLSDEISVNQRYCANHEALKNVFFELKPKCEQVHPASKTAETVYKSCRYVPQRSGVYRIAINGSYEQHVLAYCEMEQFEGGWMVFQRRQDGSVDFNRSWSEYRNGFGSPSGEHWLGLETLHDLTTRNHHELLIILENYNGTTKYERYSGLVVNGEWQKYNLFLKGSGTGTAGDSLYIYGTGEPFIAYDVQDTSESNCARELASGSWHFSCHSIRNNLNGVYGTTAGKQGIWWGWINEGPSTNLLKRVQMMIREIQQ